MAIRNDLIIDWVVAPRIITVEAPSVELGVQDLYDTLRFMEAAAAAMDNAPIVDASGKETLDTAGTLVGITVTLQNALVAFEARPGPDWAQCSISGGNLVAIDDLGATFTTPVSPTAYTQVVMANSSSATLQEQEALQYASFNGGVTYDTSSPYSGTQYPVGTPQQPVNNAYDAGAIAQERGFTLGYIVGDLLFPTDLPLEGFTFLGSGKDRTTVTIPDAATVSGCTYIEANVTGFLDGNNVLKECIIEDLSYIKGFIEQCVLEAGTIVLAGSEDAHFLDCWSGQPGLGTPIIDMGGSGQSLALRNYNGGIKLTNKSGPEDVSIDMNSGQIILDNTVTGGTIVLRGVGEWANEETYTGGANVINELVSGKDLQDIHKANFNKRVWDKIGNTITIFDDDGVTPLYIFDTNDDMSIISPISTFINIINLLDNVVDGANNVVL